MTSGEKLTITIIAKDSASKIIGGIDKGLRDLSAFSDKLLMGAAGAGIAVAGAATAAGIAMGKMAIDAAPLANVEAAFAGIAGNAEEMLAALRRGSAGMVTDIDLMRDYNLAAQLVGKSFADDLPNAMGYLTKVAASTNESMSYMMNSLVRGVGRMSPLILDNLGIQVSLAEATDRAAQMFGKEADSLSRAEKQAGMMSVVLEKLEENTRNIPDVTSSAAQQVSSLGIAMQNLRNRIGLALVPALQRMLGPLTSMVDRMLPRLVELFESYVVPAVEKVAGAVGLFFDRLGQGESLLDAFHSMLRELFPEETAQRIVETVSALASFAEQVIAFVQDHGPALIGAIAGIAVALAAAKIYTTIAAIVAIFQTAGPIIIGILGAISAPALIIIAIAAALGAAWATNFLGIRDVLTDVWNNTLQPIFAAVVSWLQTNIPIAIQALTGFWNDKLLPALRAVWAFITDYIVPLFQALADVYIALLNLALTALAGLWEKVLLPALTKVWDFIETALGPAITWLTDKVLPALQEIIEKKVAPALEWFKNTILGGLTTALDGVKNAISWVTDKLRALKSSIENIRLPDWLTPGSPTPFELGLRGISSALDELNRRRLPAFRANIGGLGAAAQNVTNNSFQLSIQTSATVEPIIADFNMLRAMAR